MASLAGLVDYREGSSGNDDSDDEYIVPPKRAKIDRTTKGLHIISTPCNYA